MGRRKGVETAVAIMEAFRARRTWTQAELARHVEITPRALRVALVECQRAGMPIEREEEHRALVYWSVPEWWSRGLADEEVRACARLVARLPSTKERDRLLSRLLGREAATAADAPSERVLRALEDGAATRRSLSIAYRSSREEGPTSRHVSIARIEHGPRARFLAVCHRSGALKTFRVDRVAAAALDEREPFRPVTEQAVAAYVAGSLDGFHGDALVDCAFVVTAPEASWVVGNLPPGALHVERLGRGCRVTVRTTALVVLARYLVGLGDAVRIETPALALAVLALAERAVAAAAATSAPKPLVRVGGRNSAPGAATKSESR